MTTNLKRNKTLALNWYLKICVYSVWSDNKWKETLSCRWLSYWTDRFESGAFILQVYVMPLINVPRINHVAKLIVFFFFQDPAWAQQQCYYYKEFQISSTVLCGTMPQQIYFNYLTTLKHKVNSFDVNKEIHSANWAYKNWT